MKYLSEPTARLPNERLIIEREFIADVTQAINALNDEVAALRSEISRLDASDASIIGAASAESASRVSGDEALSEALEKTNSAIAKLANAVNIVLEGE